MSPTSYQTAPPRSSIIATVRDAVKLRQHPAGAGGDLWVLHKDVARTIASEGELRHRRSCRADYAEAVFCIQAIGATSARRTWRFLACRRRKSPRPDKPPSMRSPGFTRVLPKFKPT